MVVLADGLWMEAATVAGGGLALQRKADRQFVVHERKRHSHSEDKPNSLHLIYVKIISFSFF